MRNVLLYVRKLIIRSCPHIPKYTIRNCVSLGARYINNRTMVQLSLRQAESWNGMYVGCVRARHYKDGAWNIDWTRILNIEDSDWVSKRFWGFPSSDLDWVSRVSGVSGLRILLWSFIAVFGWGFSGIDNPARVLVEIRRILLCRYTSSSLPHSDGDRLTGNG